MNVAVTTSCQLPVLGSCEPGTEMHRGMVLTPPELANIGVAEMAAVHSVPGNVVGHELPAAANGSTGCERL